MVQRKAVLIGCNYPDKPQISLHGCINDVNSVKQMLLGQFGFQEQDISVLIDTDQSFPQPTGANIRKTLQEVGSSLQSGDIFFVHYSGHGTQVPPESGEKDDTGKEECIVPTDLNLMTDDDFRDIVNALPAGVQFTMVSDSCHSGGLIDSLPQQIGPSEDVLKQAQQQQQGATKSFDASSIPGLQQAASSGGLFGSVLGAVAGCGGLACVQQFQQEQAEDQQGEEEPSAPLPEWAKHREVKLDQLLQLLSSASGQKVDVGNIRTTLFQMFGKDASPMVQNFVGVLLAHGPQIIQSVQQGQVLGALSSLAMDFVQQQMQGGGQQDQQQQQDGGSQPAAPPAAQQPPQVQHAATNLKPQDIYAGAKPAGSGAGSRDLAVVLVSGCQFNETSADCNPNPSDPSSAHGALTNALVTVLQSNNYRMSNKDLVEAVRQQLGSQNFTQHPCLYGPDQTTSAAFIVRNA